MARCQDCDKHTQIDKQVSHSGRRSSKAFKPNLHKYMGRVLCTKCLRKYKKQEVSKVSKVPQGVKTDTQVSAA